MNKNKQPKFVYRKFVKIYWKSKITGNTGNGSQLMPINDALQIVKLSNKKFPEITHWFA